MTETSSPTGEGPAGPPPPPPPPGPWGAPPPPPPGGGTQSAGDALRRIRRRPDDKVIGGVAAAIARALDIDPVIIRIAFVALAVFGGSGIVLYAAAWALIPEWPEERSWLARTLEGRNGTAAVVLTVLGALILVPVALRALWWGPWDGGPFVLLPIALIALGVVLLTRGDTESPPPGSTPADAATSGPPDAAPPDPSSTAADPSATGAAGSPTGGEAPTTSAAWGPPASDAPAAADTSSWAPPGGTPPPGGAPWSTTTPPTPPPTPARPRTRVTPITLSLLAIGLGLLVGADGLGWIDTSPAAALSLLLVGTGVGLAVGAVIGGGRGLIAPGVVMAVLLGGALVVDVPVWSGAGERVYRPATLDELEDEYRLGAGRLVLDLRDLDLDGETRQVDVGVTFGEIEVWVPDDVDVVVDSDVRVGEADVLGRLDDGWRNQITTEVDRTDDAGRLELEIDLGAGRAQVR